MLYDAGDFHRVRYCLVFKTKITINLCDSWRFFFDLNWKHNLNHVRDIRKYKLSFNQKLKWTYITYMVRKKMKMNNSVVNKMMMCCMMPMCIPICYCRKWKMNLCYSFNFEALLVSHPKGLFLFQKLKQLLWKHYI